MKLVVVTALTSPFDPTVRPSRSPMLEQPASTIAASSATDTSPRRAVPGTRSRYVVFLEPLTLNSLTCPHKS